MRWRLPLAKFQPNQIGVFIRPSLLSFDLVGGGRKGRANWYWAFALPGHHRSHCCALFFFTPISINDVWFQSSFPYFASDMGVSVRDSPQPPPYFAPHRKRLHKKSPPYISRCALYLLFIRSGVGCPRPIHLIELPLIWTRIATLCLFTSAAIGDSKERTCRLLLISPIWTLQRTSTHAHTTTRTKFQNSWWWRCCVVFDQIFNIHSLDFGITSQRFIVSLCILHVLFFLLQVLVNKFTTFKKCNHSYLAS